MALTVSQVPILRSSGQGQGHGSRNECLCILFTFGLSSIESQCLVHDTNDNEKGSEEQSNK